MMTYFVMNYSDGTIVCSEKPSWFYLDGDFEARKSKVNGSIIGSLVIKATSSEAAVTEFKRRLATVAARGTLL